MEFWKAEQFDGAPAGIDALCGQQCSYDRSHAGSDEVCEALPLRDRKSLRLLIVQDGVARRLRESATPLKSCAADGAAEKVDSSRKVPKQARGRPEECFRRSYADLRSRGFGSSLRRMANWRQPRWISKVPFKNSSATSVSCSRRDAMNW